MVVLTQRLLQVVVQTQAALLYSEFRSFGQPEVRGWVDYLQQGSLTPLGKCEVGILQERGGLPFGLAQFGARLSTQVTNSSPEFVADYVVQVEHLLASRVVQGPAPDHLRPRRLPQRV